MSPDRDFPQSETDSESFGCAPDAGALDAGWRYRPTAHDRADQAAAEDCRRAEALLHQGRREEAVERCRRALPRAGGDDGDLRICAWVFSNCGCHDEAAAAYRALLDGSPDWVDGHRHLSGSLAAAGHLERAVEHAVTASDLAPHDPEFALHAGALLRRAGRCEEAARYLDRAAALAPDDARTLYEFAAVYDALGNTEEAVASALDAAALAPGEANLAVDVAELLLRCGRPKAAAELLQRLAAGAAEPRLLRVLSAAEMVRGRLEPALAAVDAALAKAPDEAEYHTHRGHLLWQLGDTAGAGLALARAAALDPSNRDVKRGQLSLYLAAGLLSEATAAGGELLQRFPDDEASAAAVLHLLNHRQDVIDGEYAVLGDRADRTVRPARPSPGFFARLRRQRGVVAALVIRETRTRFADAKLGYGWALIEPILHITLLSAAFSLLLHGRPPIGGHFFIFYYTGLIPYLLFVHTSSGMSHAITGNAAVLQLPPVTSFDVIAARGLLEIMTDLIVAAILLAAFGALGVASLPDDLWGPAMALMATAAFGCGLGCVNAVVTVFVRSWEKTYAQVTRVLYFISGIFYMPDARAFVRVLTVKSHYRLASRRPRDADSTWCLGWPQRGA